MTAEGGTPAPTTKQEYRRQLRRKRAAMPPEERAVADAAICQQVQTLSAWEGAGLVLAYLSMGSEVETRPIIQAALAAGKQVALPRCVPNSRLMRWHEVRPTGLDGSGWEHGLERSNLGVDEPADDDATLVDPNASAETLVLVPGMAFDLAGYRMGYGGGFYDTFLYEFPGTSAGLCREAQLLESIGFIEAHDLAVDFVVTDRRVI
jgi:5-formyltetrahydrofolate cyclo-ligase